MTRSTALIFLMTPLALHAQGTSPRVKTHIVTYAPAALPDGFQAHYRNDGNIQPFTVSVGTFGSTTPYIGPGDLVIYASTADGEPPAAGNKPDSPVASVTLPEKCDVALILCTRAADDKVSLSAHSLDSPDLKPGTYRFFNLSKSTVSLTVGDQKREVPAGEDSILSDPSWLEKPMALHIEIAAIVDGNPNPFYSTVREHYPKSRTLMFCFDSNDPSDPINYATLDADKLLRKPAAGKQPPNRRKP